MAYGLVLLLTVGTFVFYGFESLTSRSSGTHNKAVLILNPILATADSVAGQSGAVSVSSPLTSLRRVLHNGSSGNQFSSTIAVPGGGFVTSSGTAFATPVFGPGLVVPLNQSGRHQVPYAAYSLACFALLTAGSLGIAVRKTRTPAASDRS
jgi:hypothetical protein